MRSQAFRVVALVWAIAWFGAVLPGHTRGSVKLPGFDRPAIALAETEQTGRQAPACPLCVSTGEAGEQDAPAAPGSCCAVCKFIGTMSTPIVFVLNTPKSYLLDWLDVVEVGVILTSADLAPARSRGPPTHL